MSNKALCLNHLAIIMDGNSRWAKSHGFSTEKGHYNGYKTAFSLIKYCLQKNVSEVTLFVLSQENIGSRSDFEINCLDKILLKALLDRSFDLVENGICLQVVGDYAVFSDDVQNAIRELVRKTRSCSKMKLNLALNYSGRWHFNECVKFFVGQGLRAKDLTDEMIQHWMTSEISDCDLLIRAGSEFRISNFLLWHLSYSEIYFSKILWPDFTAKDLDCALEWFAARKRRFGGRNV